MILNVNGLERDIEVGGRTLLEVLREDLDLPGSKEGCGIGVCGACTVLVDGKPISSCLLLAVQTRGKRVRTIEGLEHDGRLDAVQQSFIDHGAFQCAFCTPGFILSVASLLAENPSPSDDEIREHLSGNLCRCGSYQNILQAVQDLRPNPPG